jgi:hypothetical protein
MAVRTHEVNVLMTADLEDFRQKMVSMKKMTEEDAKKMANDLKRSMTKLEKATKASTKATLKSSRDQFKKFRKETDKAEDSLKNFEDAAGETDSIISALAGGLGEINPALGGMVRVGSESASVLEAVAKSGSGLAKFLGPLVVLVGAGAAAFTYFTEESAKAAEELKAQQERVKELSDAMDNFHGSNQSVLLQNVELTGAMSELDLAYMKSETQIRNNSKATREMLEQRKADFKTDHELAQQGLTDQMKLSSSREAAWAGYQDASIALRELLAEEQKYVDMGAENVEITHRRKQATDAQKKSDEEAKEASKAKAAALKREEEAQKALAAIEQERLNQMALVDAEIDKIIANEDRLASLKSQLFSSAEALAVLNPMEQIAAEEAAALERFDSMSLQALKLAEEQGHDLLSLDQKIQQERIELEEAYAQKKGEITEEIIKKEEDLNKQRMRDALALVDTIATAELDRRTNTIDKLKEEIEAAEGHLTAKQIQGLQERLEANQKAAQRAFKAQQAAAIGGVVMSTAEAVMATMGQFGFPIGLIPAGMAAAMGGAQIATILSQTPPTFHTGGAVANQAPDEFDIRVTRPEMVLNPTGAAIIGRDTVAAANSGTLGSQNQTVVVQWRNRVLDVVTADVARRPSPIRSAINRNRRAGHKR